MSDDPAFNEAWRLLRLIVNHLLSDGKSQEALDFIKAEGSKPGTVLKTPHYRHICPICDKYYTLPNNRQKHLRLFSINYKLLYVYKLPYVLEMHTVKY